MSDDRRLQETTEPDRLLTVAELAASWRVHPNTIYEYIRKQLLKIERLPSGGIRIRASEAQKCGPPLM